MNKINDGGNAFTKQPILTLPHNTVMVTEQGGITVRDYFAAKAMQGLLACGEAHGEDTKYATALAAYNIADAMLAAREVQP